MVLQANLVSLGFVHAAVVEHGRLPGPQSAHCNRAAAGATHGHARNGQQQGAKGHKLRALKARGHMVLGYVRQFIGQARPRALLLVHIHDEAGEHVRSRREWQRR